MAKQRNMFDQWNDLELTANNCLRDKQGRREREAVLDTLEATRRYLINIGIGVACDIAKRRGRVTSTEVLHVMRRDPELVELMDEVDARWVGGVFRRGWKRIGYETTGSHARPVSIWGRSDA
jgi:hypothetical protein